MEVITTPTQRTGYHHLMNFLIVLPGWNYGAVWFVLIRTDAYINDAVLASSDLEPVFAHESRGTRAGHQSRAGTHELRTHSLEMKTK
jgi:hypothetical protein